MIFNRFQKNFSTIKPLSLKILKTNTIAHYLLFLAFISTNSTFIESFRFTQVKDKVVDKRHVARRTRVREDAEFERELATCDWNTVTIHDIEFKNEVS